MKNPALPDNLKGGTFGICQTVNDNRRMKLSGGSWKRSCTECTLAGGYKADGVILDSSFPYKTIDGISERSVGTASYEWVDSPMTALNGLRAQEPTIREHHIADSFSTYLIYKPEGADSKWVPLKKVDWQFKAGAVLDTTVTPACVEIRKS
jgi:hypothetical protein